jgi:IclR family transcriptional regulator, pca regulon regulatory protein
MSMSKDRVAARRQASGKGKDFLEVLSRSISVIECVSGGGGQALTLSDIARLTHLPKPSVGRILHTLCVLGYAETVGRTFRLTPKIMHFATAYLGTGGNSRILQTACDELSSQTGQSSLAGVLDEDDVLIVAYTMPQQLMARSLGVGTRMPAFCTAGGRVILAELPEDALSEYLERLRPIPQSDYTIVDKRKIKAAILAARKDGYSSTEDEYVVGWRTIAYPLRRHDSSLFGTLNVNCKKSPVLTDAVFRRAAEACAEKATSLQGLLV